MPGVTSEGPAPPRAGKPWACHVPGVGSVSGEAAWAFRCLMALRAPPVPAARAGRPPELGRASGPRPAPRRPALLPSRLPARRAPAAPGLRPLPKHCQRPAKVREQRPRRAVRLISAKRRLRSCTGGAWGRGAAAAGRLPRAAAADSPAPACDARQGGRGCGPARPGPGRTRLSAHAQPQLPLAQPNAAAWGGALLTAASYLLVKQQ